ncbi:MAG: 2-oxoacid:acceptor oxidoreductase family protein [Deltaproteobacteria bacterium]|nr:2-oxoacid:acceptor oxidoreductase family protein [Deltaproteobacteria bacterium]
MSRVAELQVLFCGVGGQGVLRAAELFGRALFAAGKRVNIGQLHGMSQRGGSVSSFVIVGAAEAALLEGAPDVVVALEPIEAARAASAFGPRTVVLVNIATVVPYERTRAGQGYPSIDELLGRVAVRAGRVLTADLSGALTPLGLARAVGVAMLGALTRQAPFVALGVSADALVAALAGNAEAQRAFALGAETTFHEWNSSQGTRDGLQARH